MKIYDRWGEMIFETDNNTGWDGTKNGQLLNTGVYVYVISVGFSDGTIQNFHGSVTLTR